MAILSTFGSHVELNVIDKNTKQPTPIFPETTADSVFVDDSGNYLSDTLPMVEDNSGTKKGSLAIGEVEEAVIEDATLISRLTTNSEESFEDVKPNPAV